MKAELLQHATDPLSRKLIKLVLEKQANRNKSINVPNAYDWITLNQFKNEKGVQMEFADRDFMIDPLKDESRLLAVLKCSQVGFSTMSIFKAAFHNIKYGHNIIYTLPTDSDVQEFNKAKTNMILDNNSDIRGFMIDDTVHTKSFRTLDGSNVGFTFFKGTHGDSASIMQTADILIKDEFDRSNPLVLNAFKSRIKASSYKAEWEFSNPSFPGSGVDQSWRISDQKHRFYWCHRCEHASYITYEAESFDGGNTHHVCKERGEYVCGSCNNILDRRACEREWVKKYEQTQYDVSGYWISQMLAPWISARELMFDEITMLPSVFQNFDLGLPYSSGSNTLDPANIIKNIQYDDKGYVQKNPGKYNVLGVDVGGTKEKPHFHCVKGTELGIDQIIKLHGEDQLHNYMRQNNIAMCVIDNAPYKDIGIDLAAAFPGKVWRCVFDYNEKRRMLYSVDYSTRIIDVHRTQIFDRTVDGYITGDRKVYIEPMTPELFLMKEGNESLCRHWSAQRKIGTEGEQKGKTDSRDIKFDKLGEAIPMWVNAGADHFSLADVYNCLAQQIVLKHMEGVT